MTSSFQIIASSPAVAGTNVNNITTGQEAWKTHSSPAFVIVQFDNPIQIHHIKFVNGGAGMVEILGLPSKVATQGAKAKESDYKV